MFPPVIQILAISIIVILIVSSLLPVGQRQASREDGRTKEPHKEPPKGTWKEPGTRLAEELIKKTEEKPLVKQVEIVEVKKEESIVPPVPPAGTISPLEIKKTAVEEVAVAIPIEQPGSLKNEEEEHKKVIMAFLEGKTEEKLTHEEIERFLAVPDDTVTRYLEELEREGKITKTSAGSEPVLKRSRAIFSMFQRQAK